MRRDGWSLARGPRVGGAPLADAMPATVQEEESDMHAVL